MKTYALIPAIFCWAAVVAQTSGGAWTPGLPTARPGDAGTPAASKPVIGTHYDDPAVAHYEPPHTTDGVIAMDEAGVVAYPYLREADIKFKRRVWRQIDTRQKMNKSFTWPGNPLTQILYELAVKGNVKPYQSDSF